MEKDNNLSQLNKEDFQKSINGKQTDLFILRNNNLEIAVTNYGGAILAVMAPDKDGKMQNVVLGHDTIDNVVSSPEPFLSTTIGRYGNRIANGKFILDGKTYQLSINNGPNSLHGGPHGFHTAVWDAEQKDESSLILTYLSKDGEENFPGNLKVKMTYSLDDENNFTINYEATTDKKSIVNLTNHAFFNLAGISENSPSTENNILTINADHYVPINEFSIPTGEIRKVEGTPMNFLSPTRVGERINDTFEQLVLGAGYDHCYVLNKKEPGELSFAAECIDPISGRTLKVFTTEPGLQLYTGNWLNGFTGAHGATFPKRSGICFEAQLFPDTPNNSYFPSAILTPEGKYTQTTIYQFGVIK